MATVRMEHHVGLLEQGRPNLVSKASLVDLRLNRVSFPSCPLRVVRSSSFTPWQPLYCPLCALPSRLLIGRHHPGDPYQFSESGQDYDSASSLLVVVSWFRDRQVLAEGLGDHLRFSPPVRVSTSSFLLTLSLLCSDGQPGGRTHCCCSDRELSLSRESGSCLYQWR